MKYDKSILKFLRKNTGEGKSGHLPEKLSTQLGVTLEELLPNLRHLENIGYIASRNQPNWVGNLDIKDKLVSITSSGIIFLEEKNPKKIQTWAPIWISAGALIIAIIALFKSS